MSTLDVKPSRRALAAGSSDIPRKTPYGQMSVVGKAGDVVRVTACDIFDGVRVGTIQVQSTAGSVMVYRTLVDLNTALNPDQDTGAHWVLDHTAAPGAITPLKSFATALRLEFQTDAVLYIVGI